MRCQTNCGWLFLPVLLAAGWQAGAQAQPLQPAAGGAVASARPAEWRRRASTNQLAAAKLVEAAGIKDVLSKRYGSNNPINVVKATFQALSELTSLEEQARLRGMTTRELHTRRVRREAEPQEQ